MTKIADAAGAIKVQADLILAAEQTAAAAAVLTPQQKALQDAAIAYAVSVGYAKPGAVPTPVPTPTPTPKGFRLLDATNYIGKPGQTASGNFFESGTIPGFEGVAYIHEHACYPAGQDHTQRMNVPPTADGVRAAYDLKVGQSKRSIVVVNLENFDWAFVASDAQFRANVDAIAEVCRKVRALATEQGRTIEMCWYGFVPYGSPYPYAYPGAPGIAEQVAKLPAIHAAMKPIVDQVDFLSPCLYPYTDGTAEDHKLYAEGVIAAARTISQGKPVIPHWDWRYQTGGNFPASEAIYRQLLRSIRAKADGIVFWGGNDLQSANGDGLPWSDKEVPYMALMSEVS